MISGDPPARAGPNVVIRPGGGGEGGGGEGGKGGGGEGGGGEGIGGSGGGGEGGGVEGGREGGSRDGRYTYAAPDIVREASSLVETAWRSEPITL